MNVNTSKVKAKDIYEACKERPTDHVETIICTNKNGQKKEVWVQRDGIVVDIKKDGKDVTKDMFFKMLDGSGMTFEIKKR